MENTFTVWTLVGAVCIAAVLILVFSQVREPYRQTLNALLIAGAGAIYWSGGFGVWEFPFAIPMFFCAYRGLTDYRFIGFGWLLHTAWDVAHHFYGDPIVPFALDSSAGCAICDPILALWFFRGAPTVIDFFGKTKTPELKA